LAKPGYSRAFCFLFTAKAATVQYYGSHDHGNLRVDEARKSQAIKKLLASPELVSTQQEWFLVYFKSSGAVPSLPLRMTLILFVHLVIFAL
jgi:hypothetical protein